MLNIQIFAGDATSYYIHSQHSSYLSIEIHYKPHFCYTLHFKNQTHAMKETQCSYSYIKLGNTIYKVIKSFTFNKIRDVKFKICLNDLK